MSLFYVVDVFDKFFLISVFVLINFYVVVREEFF